MADDFLSRVQQSDTRLGNLKFKLPSVKRDSRIFGAFFQAPIKKLRKLIRSKSIQPTQFFPGIGFIAIYVYEHRDTDIGPYNEFSVVIPLYSPRFAKIPVYNFLKMMASNENHNFLLHRAANSETAVRILKEHFLFPDFQASIEFTESNDWKTCEVKEDGELICRLRGRKIPTQGGGMSKYFISTPQHHQPQVVDINRIQMATTRKPSDAELTLSSTHPIAVEISDTLKSVKPRFYGYAPKTQWAAYGPEVSR